MAAIYDAHEKTKGTVDAFMLGAFVASSTVLRNGCGHAFQAMLAPQSCRAASLHGVRSTGAESHHALAAGRHSRSKGCQTCFSCLAAWRKSSQRMKKGMPSCLRKQRRESTGSRLERGKAQARPTAPCSVPSCMAHHQPARPPPRPPTLPARHICWHPARGCSLGEGASLLARHGAQHDANACGIHRPHDLQRGGGHVSRAQQGPVAAGLGGASACCRWLPTCVSIAAAIN